MTSQNKGDQGITGAPHQINVAEEDHSGIVQCNGYRCWARKGADAKWRDMRGTPLEVLQVVAEF